jgi:hypothetical protein
MPRLGWIVMAGLGWSFVLEVIGCTKLRASLFGGTYRAYQVLNMGDAITLLLILGGMICLAVLSIALITGRVRSGLAADRLERGGPQLRHWR